MSTPVLEKEPTVLPIDTEQAPTPRRICFVCTGNTCRSPMAAAVANAVAKKEGLNCVAYSAGLFAASGDRIAQNAVSALENMGIETVEGADYHTHTAHTLSGKEAERYDLLIGMGASHAMELLMRFPSLASRIGCMQPEIPDPYGGDLTVYRACLSMICEGVERLLGVGGEA